MIEEFKRWLSELGSNAVSRKNSIYAETGVRPKWDNRTKNTEIKKRFSEEALKIPGILPRSSSDRKAREWLYDMIWRKFDEDNDFIGVLLVMEIELSDMKKSGLVYDFNKVLQSDAEYKLFVCQQRTLAESVQVLGSLRAAAEKYDTRVKSSILLSCWCWETAEFSFDNFIVSPQHQRVHLVAEMLGLDE